MFDHANGRLHRMIEGEITIPNGISWSTDDKLMYFTDSATGCVFSYDFDPEVPSITNRRTFYKVLEEGAVPDGHAQDVDGNLWVAIWGGWKVLCITPEGEAIAQVLLPTRCITVRHRPIHFLC